MPTSWQTLCDPMDYSLPGFSVHGTFQARILECVAISFSGDLPGPGIEPVSPALAGGFFTAEPPRKPMLGTGINFGMWSCFGSALHHQAAFLFLVLERVWLKSFYLSLWHLCQTTEHLLPIELDQGFSSAAPLAFWTGEFFVAGEERGCALPCKMFSQSLVSPH